MGKGSYASLRSVRTELLGYRARSVSRLTGIRLERLREIEEQGASPTVFELEAMAKLYGLDADLLADEPIVLRPGDAVEALTYSEEFVELADTVRARIVAAATAARDLRRLQELDGYEADEPAFLLDQGAFDPHEPPYRQGAILAERTREKLGLGSEPISSMRDVVRQGFPWITQLYAKLTGDGPAGLTFADELRGPTIVLNLDGKNRNPAVRRFSLAHELLHLLADWSRSEPLAILSGYFTESALAREQRANAFAIRFLCPEKVLRSLRPSEQVEAAKTLIEGYGLHYSAVRLYLQNEAGMKLPPVPPPALQSLGTETTLEKAEAPEGVENFPIADAPPERRTAVAVAAARCYSAGKLSRDAFADALGVTPAHELEEVLDFFALPYPDDDEPSA